jgi:membrane-associated HD superfamily phosphohydrolase
MTDESIKIENEEVNDVLSELLDTKYPLLQKFREACPGTYKHSQALMSMIESVADALELEVNFMRVCALYHDIGKIYNPKYFIER